MRSLSFQNSTETTIFQIDSSESESEKKKSSDIQRASVWLKRQPFLFPFLFLNEWKCVHSMLFFFYFFFSHKKKRVVVSRTYAKCDTLSYYLCLDDLVEQGAVYASKDDALCPIIDHESSRILACVNSGSQLRRIRVPHLSTNLWKLNFKLMTDRRRKENIWRNLL